MDEEGKDDRGGEGEQQHEDDDDELLMDELADVEFPTFAATSAPSPHGSGSGAPMVDAVGGAPSVAAGWDDRAIMSCFDVAVRSHSSPAAAVGGAGSHGGDGDGGDGGGSNDGRWKPGPPVRPRTVDPPAGSESKGGATGEPRRPKEAATEEQAVAAQGARNVGGRWKPGELPLPGWAVEPCYAAQHIGR